MGSRLYAAITFSVALFATTGLLSATETKNSDYRKTALHYERPLSQVHTTSIKGVIQQNDHTARIFLDPRRRNLLIIHHKSIGMQDLETEFADTGISVKAVAQSGGQPGPNPLPPPHPGISALALRNCTATMDTWEKLLN